MGREASLFVVLCEGKCEAVFGGWGMMGGQRCRGRKDKLLGLRVVALSCEDCPNIGKIHVSRVLEGSIMPSCF